MKALLVQARSPETYWSFDTSLRYAGKAATLPPLGLATLAALLPQRWELRIVDLQLGPIRNKDLSWADVVLVSGMLVQSASIRDVLRRAHRELPERALLSGYRRVLSTLYPEEAYYARCSRYLELVRLQPGAGLRHGWIGPLARALWGIGVAGPRRRSFWRLLAQGARRGRAGFSQAVALAVVGEHFVCYTNDVVLPRLDAALASLSPSPSPAEASCPCGSRRRRPPPRAPRPRRALPLSSRRRTRASGRAPGPRPRRPGAGRWRRTGRALRTRAR